MGNCSPLNGIKVANFSWVGVGPQGIKYLACWGAEVVRVESHRRPDMARLMLPFKDGISNVDRQPWFADINGSTHSVGIDLNTPSGLDIAWKLIEWADVMAESFTPGKMKKWGLDYESVIKEKPDIIYLSTSQTGGTGPLANFSGFGVHAAAMVHNISPILMDYFVNGRSMIRRGNTLPYAAPHNAYSCKGDDRWCAIAVMNDTQWNAFCEVVNQDWTGDSKFSTLLSRKKNEAELDMHINEWTAKFTAEDIEKRMQEAGVPCHVLENIEDNYNDSQLKHRDFLPKLKHSVMGYHTYHKHGFKLSEAEGTWYAGPALGEHNEYVLKELLGMTDEEIADALIAGGITTDADLPVVRGVI
ncbi:MAG: CoA transferase [Dehalococcoidia bacterium]